MIDKCLNAHLVLDGKVQRHPLHEWGVGVGQEQFEHATGGTLCLSDDLSVEDWCLCH